MELEEHIERGLCHSVHTSERRSFRSCRRRWNWVYREYLYPKVTPKPLEFGVSYHKAMERYYDPEMWNHREVSAQLALVEFENSIKEQLNNYRRLNGEPDGDILLDYQERSELGLKMIEYYTTRVSPELDQGLSPVAVEVPFEIPLGFNCSCQQCQTRWDRFAVENNLPLSSEPNWLGLPVTFGGRIDALMREDKTGRIYSFDWKTTSRILDEDAEAAFLDLDDQVSGYCVALWRMNHPVWGFIYHEQKKAVPGPPEELTRLYKGRRFSTSKNSNTDYDLFVKTLKEKDYSAYISGMYDDYLNWLKTEGPKYFQRHRVHRNRNQLQNAWNELLLEARDMTEDPRVYAQPGRFSCTTCSYRQPCVGKNMGEDYEYTLNTLFERKDRHYYEEAEKNSDK